jgi:hypothetical protein
VLLIGVKISAEGREMIEDQDGRGAFFLRENKYGCLYGLNVSVKGFEWRNVLGESRRGGRVGRPMYTQWIARVTDVTE